MRVLVVADVQKDFVDGALGSITAQSIIPHMRERIRGYADGNTLILFTKTVFSENYDKTSEDSSSTVKYCVRGTSGWSLIKEISTLADGYSNFLIYSDEEVIRSRILKETFGSVKLCEILKKYEHDIADITFMGFHTDTAVTSNALMARAYLPNTRIIVDSSCCAGSTLDKHLAALEVMKSCQIDVIS